MNIESTCNGVTIIESYKKIRKGVESDVENILDINRFAERVNDYNKKNPTDQISLRLYRTTYTDFVTLSIDEYNLVIKGDDYKSILSGSTLVVNFNNKLVLLNNSKYVRNFLSDCSDTIFAYDPVWFKENEIKTESLEVIDL